MSTLALACGVELTSQPTPQSGALVRLHLLEPDWAQLECLTEGSSAGARRDREKLSTDLGRNQGRQWLLPLTAVGHKREEGEGIVPLALLTSRGQKTLLARKAGHCQMQASASGTLTCTQDNAARDFWLGGTRSDELPMFALC